MIPKHLCPAMLMTVLSATGVHAAAAIWDIYPTLTCSTDQVQQCDAKLNGCSTGAISNVISFNFKGNTIHNFNSGNTLKITGMYHFGQVNSKSTLDKFTDRNQVYSEASIFSFFNVTSGTPRNEADAIEAITVGAGFFGVIATHMICHPGLN